MSEPWSATPESAESPQTEAGQQALTGRNVSARQRLLAGVAVLVVAVLASGAIGFVLGRGSAESSAAKATASAASAASAAKQSRIKDAYDRCQGADSGTLELGDGGTTIVVDTGSKYGSTVGMDCVLGAPNTPQSIKAELGRTTAMMGVQDAEHDGIQYSWSYHPDNGVNMVITDAS